VPKAGRNCWSRRSSANSSEARKWSFGPTLPLPSRRSTKRLAAQILDAFVEALTLAGPPAEVAAGVTRLAHSGITQIIVAPGAPDGRIGLTVERFQAEVMPRVRQDLATCVVGAA
jgi:alkanesulfonate monooxygenase SsuD/methylene tetrahydromethanopterin reductase-like flavin-dependent oxidoreductase (luciferase family)